MADGKPCHPKLGSPHRRCAEAACCENGRSAEAEHRALLEELLLRPKGKSFAEALVSMPNVGEDEDFERGKDPIEHDRVFD